MESNKMQLNSIDFFEGKHLIFKLEDNDYGIPIMFVNEIIGLMDITPVPQTPYFFKGIINLRGKIIPVIDLRLKFNMDDKAYDEKTCIIIVNISQNEKNDFVGLVVDMVSEVYNIPSSEIETNFKYGMNTENNILTGMGKIKEKVVMLLDITTIINWNDINEYIDMNNEIMKF